MYKIVKVYKTILNKDYTGVIHMVRYTNSDNYKETGIMFLEQDFSNGNVINKCSFFGEEGSYSVDKESIEEDFNVKVNFAGQGKFFSSIDYEGTPYYLYDDFVGTENGQNISFEEAQINEPSLRSIYSRFNKAKKIIENDDYSGDYDLIQSLECRISILRSAMGDLENQVAYIKRKNKNDFARKMDKR